jgi:hypothetical protein
MDLELDELSLVDRPANQAATICLVKRDSPMQEEYLKERQAFHMEAGASEDEAMKMAEEELSKMPEAEYEEMFGKTEDEADKEDDADKAEGSEEADKEDEEAEKEEDEAEKEDEEEASKSDELLAEVDALKAENDRLSKALEDNGFVVSDEAITKAAPAPEFIELDGEQIAKSDIPAPVLKALEAVEIEKKQIELRKQAAEILPHFENEVAANILKAVSGDDAIVEALKAADAAIGASMSEVGEASVEADMASPKDKLDSLVKSHMDENAMPKSAFAKAYAAVAKTDEGKALIKELYKGE